MAKGKRTFQPNNRRRARVHGFRLRMRTRAGRAIISVRRGKGRAKLTACSVRPRIAAAVLVRNGLSVPDPSAIRFSTHSVARGADSNTRSRCAFPESCSRVAASVA